MLFSSQALERMVSPVHPILILIQPASLLNYLVTFVDHRCLSSDRTSSQPPLLTLHRCLLDSDTNLEPSPSPYLEALPLIAFSPLLSADRLKERRKTWAGLAYKYGNVLMHMHGVLAVVLLEESVDVFGQSSPRLAHRQPRLAY